MAETLDEFWTLDGSTDFLNHGSFGATPRPVQEEQARWRRRLEAQPVRFFQRELEAALDNARAALAEFLGAPSDDLLFVPNATSGVNAVLRSYDLDPGDQILITDQAYNACANAARYAASSAGAEVVVASVPFPLQCGAEVVDSIMDSVGERTRLAIVEHVTSPTGLILPINEVVAGLRDRGVDVLVDGAHAAGMVDVDIRNIDATFYAGNCHKWLCAPKGAGFLYVAPDHQSRVVPTVVSHGYNTEHEKRSRFHLLFDWPGTQDPTALLSVPAALSAMEGVRPGGWPVLMDSNRRLALRAREIICKHLDVEPPAPEHMVGAMAAIPLPDADEQPLPYGRDPLQDHLFFEDRFEVPVLHWPEWPSRLIRISAQAYNSVDQYERLGNVLRRRLIS